MAVATLDEYLTIGAVIIGTDACWATNLEVLHSEAHRGQDRLVPGSAGVIPNPRRLAPIRHVLELKFFGHYTSSGASVADARAGLIANIDEVKTITAPVTTGDGTRTVVWTLPDGTTRSADCHVGPLITGTVEGSFQLATLDLNVPAGQFV